MFLKKARTAYFDLIKTKLSPFVYLPREFHDPTLNFNSRLYRYVTDKNTEQNLANTSWIGILWKRNPINTPTTLTEARRFELRKEITVDPTHPMSSVNDFKFGSCSMSVTYYSNDIDILETFEEYMFLLLDPSYPLSVIYPELHPTKPIKCLVNDFKRTEFIKEEREGFANLAKLSTTFDLIYPIIKYKKDIKHAYTTNFKIKLLGTDKISSEIVREIII